MSDQMKPRNSEPVLMPWETGAVSEPSQDSIAAAAESLFGMLEAPEGTTESPNEPAADPEAVSDSEAEGVSDSAVDSGDGAPQDGATDETEAEDEGEASEGESESEEAQDEEEQADSEARTYKVRVDGEDREVTEDELVRGYISQATFTRRMQEVAALRKDVETERGSLQQLREQYLERIQIFEDALKAMQPAEPDWERLRVEDPAEYAAQMADFQRRERQLEIARAERDRLLAEQRAEQDRALQALLREEAHKLVQAIPEFSDPASAATERAKMVAYAKDTYGFSDEDLAQVYDHRVLVLLRKAMKWDELQSQTKPEVLKKVKRKAAPTAKVLQPGSPKRDIHSGRKSARVRSEAFERLAHTGRVDDAAAAIEQLLGEDF